MILVLVLMSSTTPHESYTSDISHEQLKLAIKAFIG